MTAQTQTVHVGYSNTAMVASASFILGAVLSQVLYLVFSGITVSQVMGSEGFGYMFTAAPFWALGNLAAIVTGVAIMVFSFRFSED